MAIRILTLLLLLGMSRQALAQVATPAVEQGAGAPRNQPARPTLPFRPAPPPPLAPAATTRLDAADRLDVLLGVAAFLRQRVGEFATMAGGDSVAIDPRYHASPFPIPISDGELQFLLRELRGVPAARETVEGDCRQLVGCALSYPQFIVLGEPVLRVDGTATIFVEHRYRFLNYRLQSGFEIFELLLSRAGDTWTVTRASTSAIS